MSLLSPYIKGQLRSINTNAVDTDIALRRGTSTLGAQRVLLSVHQSSPSVRETEGGEEVRVDGEARGIAAFDVAIDDRFNWGGVLFRVVFVRPDRSVATIAEVSIIA